MAVSLKDTIFKNINILDIAEEFSIELEDAYSGSFSHRCRCPSNDHKNGKERTRSCYIDVENNKFFCFGCSKGHNVIDFYMMCADKNFSEAINELKSRIDIDREDYEPVVIRPTNLDILMKISVLFRETMLSNPKKLGYLNNLMIKTDEYVQNINKYDIKNTNALYEKLCHTIKKGL